MKSPNKNYLVSIILIFLIGASCQSPKPETSDAAPSEPQELSKEGGQAFIEDDEARPNVLQIAISSEDHSTLVAAVQAADLENALVNAGPLTVFAPVNSAFDALPEGTVESLLLPENKEKLASILKHHVTPAGYPIEVIRKFENLGQADGTKAKVEVKGEDVYVGGAKIIATVDAGNGIVHVVDAVILPPSN
jgi:uncharacterized surface protein with fasciclin (FAS1) repeats